MPILRCPDCSTVVAHRGKALAFPCPGEHAESRRTPTLHVDRHGIERNGHAIDVHRPTGDGEREVDVERVRELLAYNLARSRRT